MELKIIQLIHMCVTGYLIIKLILTINNFKSQDEVTEVINQEIHELKEEVLSLKHEVYTFQAKYLNNLLSKLKE